MPQRNEHARLASILITNNYPLILIGWVSGLDHTHLPWLDSHVDWAAALRVRSESGRQHDRLGLVTVRPHHTVDDHW